MWHPLLMENVRWKMEYGKNFKDKAIQSDLINVDGFISCDHLLFLTG